VTDYFDIKECQNFLYSQALAKVLSGTATLAQANKTVLKLLDLLGYPHPSDRLLRAFCHPSVASLFVESLWQRLPHNSRLGRRPEALAHKLYRRRANDAVVKGRILGPLGTYPNIEVDFGSVQYVPLHGIPLLITSEEHDVDEYTELAYLSEPELAAASAISLAEVTPLFHLFFESGNEIALAKASLEGLSESERHVLFYELLAFNIRPQREREIFQPPTSTLTPGQYAFHPFGCIKEAAALFAAFPQDDQLLLRTAFMLQKASMLWLNRVFSEDAVANVFFALEGCLLLLQRKSGGSDSQIDLALLTKLFNDLFERGEELFDFIKEAYDKRIEIVHPSPASGANWQPFLLADDYYEYFHIVRQLLNRILIDRIID
jgi:hypothetical protein